MIRCTQRVVGVNFADNCPLEVRHRVIAANNPLQPSFMRPRIWPGDNQWVTVIDDCIPGWKVPFFGFIPDSAIRVRYTRYTKMIRQLCRWFSRQ